MSTGRDAHPAADWEPTDELLDRASAPSGAAWGAKLAAALEGQQLGSATVLTRCVPGEEWAQRLGSGRLSVVAFGADGNGACRWLQGDGAVGPVMLWGFGVDRSLFARAFRDFGAVVPVNGR